MQLSSKILYRFIQNYYPVISRFGKNQALLYDQFYIQKAKKLQIDRVNYKQVTEDGLIKLLRQQIQKDKILFHKQKQILFVGRSNAGKSSLINILFNTKLANVAKSPGTTKYLHFYGLKNNQGTIIDSPGYGFANMNVRRRSMWFGTTYQYLKISSRVSQIIMCINAEHGVKQNDLQFLNRTHELNVNIQVVLTKCDKIKDQKLHYKMLGICQVLNSYDLKNLSNKIIAVSSKSQFGIPELKCFLVQSLLTSFQRNIDEYQDLLLQYLKQNRVKPVDIKQKPQSKLTKPYLIKKLIYNSKLTKHLV